MITQYLIYALLFILIVIASLYLFKHNHKKMLYTIVLALVVQAEQTLGSRTGPLKYALVISWIHSRAPNWLRYLFSDKEIDQAIDASVTQLKHALESGVTLAGSADELLLFK